MHAVILKKNKQLILSSLPTSPPKANQYTIKLSHTGICSSDIARAFDNGAYSYPLVMGHEFSGTVIACGKETNTFKEGQRVAAFPLKPCNSCQACHSKQYVFCSCYSYYGSRENGGYAEYLNVDEWNLIAIPDQVSLKDAAALEPLAVALHTINSCFKDKKNNKTIAIVGTGFIGLLMATIISSQYPDVTLTLIDRNLFKLKCGEKYCEKYYCLKGHDEWMNFISQKVQFDTVIETTGHPDFYNHSIDLAKPGGNIIWMSNIIQDLTIPKKQVSAILRKELKISGVWNSTYKGATRCEWNDALQLISSDIKPSEFYTHIISLEDTPTILNAMYLHKKGKKPFEAIKAVIEF